ncbi:MAG: OsmC family protein [Calditrichae bacterium]|nr:OsmC family protein [Calditrichota bacterium]MCB9058203.1 OsmC family protein [Calditrichia bacterium]
MNIELKRVNEPYHFEAAGTAGVKVSIDSSPDDGGQNAGARPMELVLMGLASCSGIDVISILRKQRQDVQDFSVDVSAERDKENIPAVFKKIHMTFKIKGDITPEKIERAIDLSINKYCSVSAMLCKTAEITTSFELV